MKRKVSLIGPSTLMVSLPSKWAKRNNIKRKQEIDIEEKQDRLIIYAGDPGRHRKKELILEKKDQFLNRYIRYLYHKGINEIKIVCNEGIDINDIEKELDAYLGFEVVEQGSKYCIIRNMAVSIEDEFSTMLRKIFFMNINMINESLENIKENNYEELTTIANIEKTNNKHVNFCYRILNKSGKIPEEEKMYLYINLFCLENIADHIRDICNYIASKKQKIGKNTEEFYLSIIQHLTELHNLYYKLDKDKIVAVRNTRDRLYQQGQTTLHHATKEEVYIVHKLLSILDQMKDMELSLDFGI
jgi:phosphate uptake regulator